jgi:DNA-binding Lrp family transcriptional regulator
MRILSKRQKDLLKLLQKEKRPMPYSKISEQLKMSYEAAVYYCSQLEEMGLIKKRRVESIDRSTRVLFEVKKEKPYVRL